MGERFVGRVRPPGNVVKQPKIVVRRDRHGVARGAARKPDVDTQIMESPELTRAIFVDQSGRRSRRLALFAYTAITFALVMLALLWLSQIADVVELSWLAWLD